MACAPVAELRITDGTTTVDLLSQASGFILDDWTPAIAEPKGGGVWQNSPLSKGRRLVLRELNNTIETLTLSVRNWNQDAVVRDTQNLRRLLTKATQYWTTNWQDEPVWLEARAAYEQNLRYALLHDWRTPRDVNPYGETFFGSLERCAIVNFALILERGLWQSEQPGTGAATEISAQQDFDGVTLGQEATSTPYEVFIANKHNRANLTDIYHYDALPAWSGNLLGAATPFAFLPAVPAVGDCAYFGCDTTVPDSGPFCSLAFDINPAQVQITGIVWEYYDTSPAWVTLLVQDNTNGGGIMGSNAFDTADVQSVHWIQPNDWATANLQTLFGGAAPNVTGFWVRARVTAVGGAPTPPQQQHRDIYSIVTPYLEVAAGGVGGDVSALAKFRVVNKSHKPTPAGVELETGRVLCGLRSILRGADFSAYLNCSDEQNPAGITYHPFIGAYVNDPSLITGRCEQWTVPGGGGTAWSQFRLDDTIAPQYDGVFHIFLRVDQDGGVGDIEYRIYMTTGIAPGGVFVDLGWHSLDNTSLWQQIDVGRATINALAGPVGARRLSIYVEVNAAAGAAGTTIRFHDVTLLPVDEWAGDFTSYAAGGEPSSLARGVGALPRYLDIDSLSSPKDGILTPMQTLGVNYYEYLWSVVANGEVILQSNAQQRLWFYEMRYDYVPAANIPAEPYIGHTLLAERSQRYYAMRGDR